MEKSEFGKKIILWYNKNKRDLPWRKTNDIYKIWLSEIILQQTRVVQGLPYYHEFLRNFPTLKKLSEANEQVILRLWQGLGYYSRARNLHNCAKILQTKYNGKFPKSYNELKKLPGIGDYTAAAIASFAYKEPVALVDGNVYRVLSRVFGIKEDIRQQKTQKAFKKLAQSLIDPDHPDLFNQAMMEMGAIQCLPREPRCHNCIFNNECYAFINKEQEALPVKSKKVKSRNRYFHYFVVFNDSQIFMKRREKKDIWQGMYDFFLIEEKEMLGLNEITHPFQDYDILSESEVYKHVLTHQNIFARFFVVKGDQNISGVLNNGNGDLRSYSHDQIQQLPKPNLIANFLNDGII